MNRTTFSGRCLPFLLGLVVFVGAQMAASETPQLTELFGKLAADDFAVRRAAQEELVKWGEKDLKKRVAFFQEKQATEEDPEVRERCRAIVKELVLILLDETRPGFIGIEMARLVLGPKGKVDVPDGVQIAGVRKGTPAEEFGLKAGDLILKIDDAEVGGFDGSKKLQDYVGSKFAGSQIQIHLEREGKALVIPLTLMKRPRDADLQLRIPFNGQLRKVPSEEELRERAYQKWLLESQKRSKQGR